MKPAYLIQKIAILITIISIYSCSPTSTLSLTVTNPAPVYLPKEIKNIGVLNRSLPNKESKSMNDLDKVLSIEGKNLDEEGGNDLTESLFNQLKRNQNLNEVKLLDNSNFKTTGLGVFPATLSWDEVAKICAKNNVQALFVVSFYDTETDVKYSTSKTSVKNPFGVYIPMIEHIARINTVIKVGFRIYDSENKIIRDEIINSRTVVAEGRGMNPIKAVETVINRKQNILRRSKDLGSDYAVQIQPFNSRVRRDYYVRGTDNFKIGKRKAQTGDWKGAAELWKAELNNPKAKIAGRATYNMAIISEINGDLNEAIDWASKAYSDYKNKNALNYNKILKERLASRNQLIEETQ